MTEATVVVEATRQALDQALNRALEMIAEGHEDQGMVIVGRVLDAIEALWAYDSRRATAGTSPAWSPPLANGDCRQSRTRSHARYRRARAAGLDSQQAGSTECEGWVKRGPPAMIGMRPLSGPDAAGATPEQRKIESGAGGGPALGT